MFAVEQVRNSDGNEGTDLSLSGDIGGTHGAAVVRLVHEADKTSEVTESVSKVHK